MPKTSLEIYGLTGQNHDDLRYREKFPWKLEGRQVAPITVVIPSIPPRIHSLNRLLKSIEKQDLQPQRVIVQLDHNRLGAADTRNRGLQKVESELVTFMDDDDYMGRIHLAALYGAFQSRSVDYIYPWFTIAGPSVDPFPFFFKRPWTNDDVHQTTIVTMVKTELAQRVGFRDPPEGKITAQGHRYGEDLQFTEEIVQAGGVIYHLPERTWYWVVTGHNTSGRPEAWADVK